MKIRSSGSGRLYRWQRPRTFRARDASRDQAAFTLVGQGLGLGKAGGPFSRLTGKRSLSGHRESGARSRPSRVVRDRVEPRTLPRKAD